MASAANDSLDSHDPGRGKTRACLTRLDNQKRATLRWSPRAAGLGVIKIGDESLRKTPVAAHGYAHRAFTSGFSSRLTSRRLG
eukprot:16988-Pleurochrysis_carterae.AAC.1